MAKLTGNNRHNVQWTYAKECWHALKIGAVEMPPVPMYDIWETEEHGTKGRTYIGKKIIEPQKVTYQGRTVYGD
jgi:hypothetical protein